MKRKKTKNLRWIIATLLFFATLINYLDRQLLSVLAPKLREDLGLTNTDLSYAFNSFLVAYGIMYVVGGWIIDRYGTRRGLSVSLVLWSMASMCHSFVTGFRGLCFSRFLLGTFQPPNFTALVKGISTWFPSKERGLAIGVAVAGVSIGAIIAAPLAVWLTLHFGWRMAFLIPSLMGLLWLPLWLYWYQHPTKHPRISGEELQYIQSDTTEEKQVEAKSPVKWKTLLRFPQVWCFIMVRFFGDPIGYFFWAWLPSYLVSEKGFSFEEMGQSVWIPYVIQMSGMIVGGYFTGQLIQRGMSPILARKWGITIPLILFPIALFSVSASSMSIVILTTSCATFGLGVWGANYNAAVMDSVPQRMVGTVAGLAGTAGVISSVLVTWFTGYAADHQAYLSVFLLNIVLISLSIGAPWILLRRPINEAQELN